MKTILVPMDFSDVTPALVSKVKQLAGEGKSKVVLLHVCVYDPGIVSPNVLPVCIETSVDLGNLQDLLNEVKSCFAGSTTEVETMLIEGGTVADNILAESECLHADKIVMGSHGHGAFYHLIAGSVTARVIRSAKCPVLVVPSPRGEDSGRSVKKHEEKTNYAY